MKFGSLFEVIVYCRDMQAQVEFYRDVLGLEISWPAGLDSYMDEHWVAFDAGSGVTLALHSGGEANSGTPPRFGFRTDGIAALRTELVTAGVSCGEVREAAPGIAVLDCRDPEGNGFFFEQHS